MNLKRYRPPDLKPEARKESIADAAGEMVDGAIDGIASVWYALKAVTLAVGEIGGEDERGKSSFYELQVRTHCLTL